MKPMFASRSLPTLALAIASLTAGAAQADSPLGWVHADHNSAYTLNERTFELTLGAIAVNEDLDFLDVREDLLAGTRQLEGDSGDISGNNLELHVGILPWLSALRRCRSPVRSAGGGNRR